MECKSKLEKKNNQTKANGMRTRSNCNWYEHGEKSSKSSKSGKTLRNPKSDSSYNHR